MANGHKNGNGDRGHQARMTKFIAHYCVHFNAAAAYRFAGFECATGSVYEMARRLLTKPDIQAAVNATIAELGEVHFKLADEAISKLKMMSEADRAQIFTPEGVLRDLDEWPDECKLLIAGVEVEELWEGSGKARRRTGNLRKVRLEGPKGILDSILKITGRWVDSTQFLDKHGRPADPPALQAEISITVGNEVPK